MLCVFLNVSVVVVPPGNSSQYEFKHVVLSVASSRLTEGCCCFVEGCCCVPAVSVLIEKIVVVLFSPLVSFCCSLSWIGSGFPKADEGWTRG